MRDDAVAPVDPSAAVERRLATILMADVFGYSRNNQPGHVKGTIAADGTVNVVLDGFNPLGKALSGSASGKWIDNKISVSGSWSNNIPVDASWTFAPDAPAESTNGKNGEKSMDNPNDQVAPARRGRRARR